MSDEVYRADPSLEGKLRRRLTQLYRRRAATGALTRPMVSFTFDDTPASAVRVGAPILESRGVKGTYFFCAGLAGTSAHMGEYATQEDMVAVARFGHEAACHTYSHLDCGNASDSDVAADLDRNAKTLADWGVEKNLKTFAYPFGDVGFPAKKLMGSRFSLSRALHHGLIEPGVDLNQAPAIGIEGSEGEALARSWLERAETKTAWVILFTHGVTDAPSPFGASKSALGRLVDQAIARGFDVVTVAEGAHRMRETA